MEFHEVLQARRSIRTFYPRPVELEKIGALIQSASLAPSVGDLQPWKFIVVTKARQLQNIADACPYEKWLYQAPLVIVICSTYDRAETYYPGFGRTWASHSCAAAAQNILLAATDLELAGCWVSSFEMPKIKETLHMPDGIDPEIILAIGYGDEDPAKKKFAPYDSYVYFNDFGANNVDMAFIKKDYGLFFRGKVEDIKTHAAYSTAERGDLRTRIEVIQDRIRNAFKRGEKKPAHGHEGEPHEHDPEQRRHHKGHPHPEDANKPVSPTEGDNYQHR